MNVIKTDNYNSTYPLLSLGIAMIHGCKFQKKHSPEFKSYKKEMLNDLRSTQGKTEENLLKYEAFFKNEGFAFPLISHLEKTKKQGFPNINIYIDTHIITEMTHGVLMGIQDADKFNGDLLLDIACEGESFEGISNMVSCIDKEIVVRDTTSIVASLLQGPDKKTLITESTTNLIIYSFMIPGIELNDIENSLHQSILILKEYAGAESSEILII